MFPSCSMLQHSMDNYESCRCDELMQPTRLNEEYLLRISYKGRPFRCDHPHACIKILNCCLDTFLKTPTKLCHSKRPAMTLIDVNIANLLSKKQASYSKVTPKWPLSNNFGTTWRVRRFESMAIYEAKL